MICLQYYEGALQSKLFGGYQLILNPNEPSCNETLLASLTRNLTQWEDALDEIPIDCLTYTENEDAEYRPSVRPVVNPNQTVDVAFHVLVTQIIEVNAKDQYMLSNIELK